MKYHSIYKALKPIRDSAWDAELGSTLSQWRIELVEKKIQIGASNI